LISLACDEIWILSENTRKIRARRARRARRASVFFAFFFPKARFPTTGGFFAFFGGFFAYFFPKDHRRVFAFLRATYFRFGRTRVSRFWHYQRFGRKTYRASATSPEIDKSVHMALNDFTFRIQVGFGCYHVWL